MAKPSEFGDFLREARKGLGLSLREFCHQNGFDAGNLSRIERGLSLPPKSHEGLEKYAIALKLKKGTAAYNRLYDLAAKETGRIPTEFLKNQSTAQKLPVLLRGLRRGAGHQNWVRAQNLEQWAQKLGSRSMLPQVIRRLVHATGKKITFSMFPSEEQTQRPGWDGVVEVAEADTFVPSGRIVFEMGVTKSPATKAEADFEKRRHQKVGFDKKETTYIFVTPRKWQGKVKWVEGKNELGVWKEVRVYDSTDLEEWLERAPAVDVWLASHLGLRPAGLTDITEYWNNLEGVTDPPLTPEVFLASREKEAKELEKWLNGPPSVAAIESRSPSEAIDFVAAFIQSSENSLAKMARSVVVEEPEAWRSISRSDGRLILIAHPKLALEPELVSEAVRQGHHVVLPVIQAICERAFTLRLPRVYRHDLEKVLVTSKMDRVRASEYATKSGGSLTVLKRLLSKAPGTTRPEWSEGKAAQDLVPMLLAGAWEEQSEGDRKVLEELSGKPYSEVLATAGKWRGVADSPLVHILSHWELISRDDSWWLLSHAATPDHLKRFEKITLEVLSEEDPAYELPPDERWMASIKNKVLRHSETIRTWLAETLALLGSCRSRIAGQSDPQGMVGYIVQRLLKGEPWQRWASLSYQLPLLAEAAPDAFLKAVEFDLSSPKPALPALFEQDGQSQFYSTSPHAGLLWALEGISWDRGMLPRVSYALARLDGWIGSKTSGNSPRQTLQAIFMCWYPQTTAPIEERIKILETLVRKHPETGWLLLLELLPRSTGHTMPIHRPDFREWALVWKEGVSSSDYERQVVACAELLVTQIGTDCNRWKDGIEHFENLTKPAAEQFLKGLLSLDLSLLDLQAKRDIAEALREKVAKHRRFSDSNWALPEKILAQLETAQRRFEPNDAVSRNIWLFNQCGQSIAFEEELDILVVEDRRQAAIKDVRVESGWDGVLRLAQAVKFPEELGSAIGSKGTLEDDKKVLPELLSSTIPKLVEFARGYIYGRFFTGRWPWVASLKTSKWPALAVAKLALCLPIDPQAWALLARKGKTAERDYWLSNNASVRDPKPKVVEKTVAKLLEFGRPFQACFVIGMARHRSCPVTDQLILDTLETGFRQPLAESEAESLRCRRHYVVELIQHLQGEVRKKNTKLDLTRVAKIEWEYLSLLNGHPASPDTLHDLLGTDPKFFVELLEVVFHKENEESEKEESSEQQKQKAQNGFRLLMSWTRVPGSREDGSVQDQPLFEWIKTARELAVAQGQRAICDHRIGTVLAHARGKSNDGGWPCPSVRDAIEEFVSDELASGFEIGIYNKRGATMRSLNAGGDQERVLSKQYAEWAKICAVEWPRTAASLQRVADHYEREAMSTDAETELRLK